jgi:Skp family chaperone for outer membrane proteins
MKTILKAAAMAVATLGAATALPSIAVAQQAAQSMIIVVDMDRVGAESAAGRSGAQQLKTRLDSIQARAKTLGDGLRTEEETLLKARQSNSMAPDAFQNKVKELQTRQNNARTELGRSEQEFGRSQGFVRQQIFNAVGPIIQAIMRERGASVVLTRDAALAVNPALDVTAEVIRRLDAALPRVGITPPAQPAQNKQPTKK